MSLKMFDVEIDEVELEEFAPAECESDALIEIVESDVVEVFALEEDETADSPAPLCSFWDCPPLALAGLFCALLSLIAHVLLNTSIVVLPLWLIGQL